MRRNFGKVQSIDLKSRKGNAAISEIIMSPGGLLIAILLLLIAILAVRELLVSPGIPAIANSKVPFAWSIIWK